MIQHVEICLNVINMKYNKQLIVLDPRLLFMRQSNDLFFFVGLVGGNSNR